MSLQFITGDSKREVSEKLISCIIELSLNDPSGKFFIIVPEQFTLQTQKDLAAMHPRGGILNIDVLSFERLAYRVFEETGVPRKSILEENSKRLILKKIALKERSKMPYLGKRFSGTSSMNDIKSTVSELMQYGVTPEELLESSGDIIRSSGEKFRDIAYIYRRYKEELYGSYMALEEVPVILRKVMDSSTLLKDAVIAFDGFTGFTPNQLPVMEKLLLITKKLMISVVKPKENTRHGGPSGRYAPGDPYDLFHMSRELTADLLRMADENNIPQDPTVRAENAEGLPDDLRFLRDNIFRTGRRSYSGTPASVHIMASHDPGAESENAAEIINNLVRKENIRYRDIAVICGALDSYSDHIRRIFDISGIPFFIDKKVPVMSNPYVEFIRSLLEMPDSGYSVNSVFRLLKCGFFDIEKEDINRLENYALSRGIKGKSRWMNDFIYTEKKEDPEMLPRLNEIRKYIMETLEPLTDSFSRPRSTVGEKCRALYDISVKLDIQKKLSARSERLREKGLLSLSGEYRRIYKVVMDILDKMVEILGPEPMSVSDFRSILDSALSDSRMGLIPPGNDQVTVGDMERTRLSSVKVLLFLGVNDGIIPSAGSNTGIISESEKTLLKERGLRLSPTPAEELFRQRFYIYLALGTPSEKLFISYCELNGNGETMRPSSLVNTIKTLFPDSEVIRRDPHDITNPERPEEGLILLPALSGSITGGRERNRFLELYKYYLTHPEYGERLNLIREMLRPAVSEDSVGYDTAELLYGDHLTISPTRLEKFAGCMFAHFLTYGLGLMERQEFSFEPMDLGNVIHKSLERYAKTLKASGRKWQDLTETQQRELADEMVDITVKDYGDNILFDSDRNTYNIKRIKRLMRRSVWAISKQLENSEYIPYAFEQKVVIPLTDNVTLRGIIDRIDICRDGDAVLVKIIDYKTGDTKFDILSCYNGIQLQLPLYMKAASEKITKDLGCGAVAAAMFYYNIKDPVISAAKIPDALSDPENGILEELTPNGLMDSEPDRLLKLDSTIGTGSKSTATGVSIKKDGTPGKNKSLITAEQFRALESFTSRKAASLSESVLSGSIEKNPYMNGDLTSCRYCPYESVCRFDPSGGSDRYRIIDGKADEIWEKILEGKD